MARNLGSWRNAVRRLKLTNHVMQMSGGGHLLFSFVDQKSGNLVSGAGN